MQEFTVTSVGFVETAAPAEHDPVPAPTPFTVTVILLLPSDTTTVPVVNVPEGTARLIVTVEPEVVAVTAELCEAAL